MRKEKKNALSVDSARCCGVAEIDLLSRVGEPKEAFKQVIDEIAWRKDFKSFGLPAFVFFTGIVDTHNWGHAATNRTDDYGKAFCEYLESNKLGSVIITDPRKNWTGSTLRMWIWQPDWARVWEFVKGL